MGCTWLTVLGGALEAVGFACIVAELARIQWREFGTPESLLRFRAWWRRSLLKLLRRPPSVASGAAAVSGGGAAGATGFKWMHMGPQEKDRLAALEHNVKVLDERLRDKTAELDQGIRKVAKDLESTRSAIDRRAQEREEERRSSLRGSMRLQVAATFFFIVGLGLSVWGSVTTC